MLSMKSFQILQKKPAFSHLEYFSETLDSTLMKSSLSQQRNYFILVRHSLKFSCRIFLSLNSSLNGLSLISKQNYLKRRRSFSSLHFLPNNVMGMMIYSFWAFSLLASPPIFLTTIAESKLELSTHSKSKLSSLQPFSMVLSLWGPVRLKMSSEICYKVIKMGKKYTILDRSCLSSDRIIRNAYSCTYSTLLSLSINMMRVSIPDSLILARSSVVTNQSIPSTVSLLSFNRQLITMTLWYSLHRASMRLVSIKDLPITPIILSLCLSRKCSRLLLPPFCSCLRKYRKEQKAWQSFLVLKYTKIV